MSTCLFDYKIIPIRTNCSLSTCVLSICSNLSEVSPGVNLKQLSMNWYFKNRMRMMKMLSNIVHMKQCPKTSKWRIQELWKGRNTNKEINAAALRGAFPWILLVQVLLVVSSHPLKLRDLCTKLNLLSFLQPLNSISSKNSPI